MFPTGRASSGAVRADQAAALGFTGQGVGVAIVDTGIDATHPDLRKRVTHNRKLVATGDLSSLGIETSPLTPPGTLVMPVDQLPYNNSDLNSGHGTHVAGIVAADGSGNQDLLGVAPGADLIGYSTGDAVFVSVFAVLAAFDDILVHQREWKIRVVNSSWGLPFQLFDPSDPINVATKALHDAGLVVVIAANNFSEEMTINPFSVAPWVISVGSINLAGKRSSFTSAGLRYDNSRAVALPEDGHLRFEGGGIGLYHPDLSAPGSGILSTRSTTGVLTLTGAGAGATLSGTSQAAPHVAGVAALLLSANPALTADQVRHALQVTARPLTEGSTFWQSGYGIVDAAAAVRLVRRPDFSEQLLEQLQAASDRRMLAQRQRQVRVVDQWAFDAPPASALGLGSRTFALEVMPGTKAIHGSVAYGGLLDLARSNAFDWQFRLVDPAGREMGRSSPSARAGVSTLFLAPSGDDLMAGRWTVEVAGRAALGEPNTSKVSVSIAQLAARP
ncbi:MAG: S8 family serine peptidase [Actinomycetota bacterium]|nr:S8 family serine peptidase [Actinomycetota bacterium]